MPCPDASPSTVPEAAHRSSRDRDRLIAAHLDVARRISLRMARRCPAWISRDDVVAAGIVGLAEAAERYDEAHGEPFLAFAYARIRGAVLDELRRGDIMPRRARSIARKVRLAVSGLEQARGRAPGDHEVAERLGVSVEHYQEFLAPLAHVAVESLDALGAEPAGTDTASPAVAAERRLLLGQVALALANLQPRDVLLLSLYYGEELSCVEIGQVLGVTTSRVCQIHGRALSRLRAALNEPALAA